MSSRVPGVSVNESLDVSAEPVIGIDLGTTYSLVAWVDATGHPVTVVNSEGDLSTPSVVFFDRSGVIVGKEAIKAAEFEPERIARFAKRDMGRVSFHRSIRGEPLPPEVIQSLVLSKLKQDAELRLGPVRRAVITVPAYFDEPRRKATEDAGRLAGLEVLDILNEPTAAAISYGVQQGFIRLNEESAGRERVLVYDLGGGTFDVTLMEIDGYHFKALGTAGDVLLGGVDWTGRIVDLLAERFVAEHGIDPRTDEGALLTLFQEAEDAKRALTARHQVNVMFAYEGFRLREKLTRAQFEEITGDLVDRTVVTIRKVLREAKLQWSDVTRLLLVGGSSRMPAIQRVLEEESGLSVDRSLSPDEAVGQGAAVYASLLSGNQSEQIRDISVRNVNSHDLGVLGKETSTGRNRRRVMIPRNTQLPCRSKSTFKTFRENQPDVSVHVVEGGDASGNSAIRIGKCVVTGLPPLPSAAPVQVTFHYAANGRISVSAYLPTIERRAELHIERASGLSEKAFEYWQSRIHEGLTDASLTSPSGESSQPEPPSLQSENVTRSSDAPVSPESVIPDSQPAGPGRAKAEKSGATRTETTEGEPAEPLAEPPTEPIAPAEPWEEAAGQSLETPVETIPTEPAALSEPSGPAESRSLTEPLALTDPIGVTSEKNASESDQPNSEPPVDEIPDAPKPPKIAVDDDPLEPTEEEIRRARRQTLKVLAINTALHALLVLILAMIALPVSRLPESFVIVSSMPEQEIDEQPLEEVVLEQPELISDDVPTEIESDVITDTQEQFEIDVNDLAPSMTMTEDADSGDTPMAPITGEMGGRSKAGRKALLTRYGGTAESEAAVGRGLSWLKKHQSPDGSWSFDHRTPQCDNCSQPGSFEKSTMGATALALLAYMGSGSSYTDGQYQKTIEAGLNYLLNNAKQGTGVLDLRGNYEGNSGMYIQGIATICLTEAAAMNEMALESADSGDRRIGVKSRRVVVQDTRKLKSAAQGAVNFIIAAQHSEGGWRYKPDEAGDTSVVGWQIMGLASARSVKLRIPPRTFSEAADFLDSVQSDGGAKYGYMSRKPKPSTTSIGLLCRMYLGWKRENPALKGGVEYLSKTGPDKNNMYYNYYATQVMHHFGGDAWTEWNDVMREHLVKTQRRTGHATGSWDVADPHGGRGGRLYMTCLAIMTLEVYYRHLPLYDDLEGRSLTSR